MAQVFAYESFFDYSREDLFDWHEAPGAFEALQPPWESVRLVSARGGIGDGAEVVIETSTFGIKQLWRMRHEDYVRGEQFCDVMEKGPFAYWRHVHHFRDEVVGKNSILRDEITFQLPGGRLTNAVMAPWVKEKLASVFRYRHDVTETELPYWLKRDRQASAQKVLITGITGMVGARLATFLRMMGYQVWGLSRSAGERTLVWDVDKGILDASQLEGFHAVIHLAGESIAQRWHDESKRRILQSRVRGTRLLVEALNQLEQPPAVLVSASGINFYGRDCAEVKSEEDAVGEGFLSDVTAAWEGEAKELKQDATRLVLGRIAVVLSTQGGALAKMLPAFKAGVAGVIGSGDQQMSWISLDDLVYSLYHCMRTESLEGPVNLTAPRSVSNREFTQVLAKVLQRPAFIPMPAAVVRTLFGAMGEETVLSNVPSKADKLTASGFAFSYPQLEQCLKHVLP